MVRQRLRKGAAKCHVVDLLQFQLSRVKENASPATALYDIHRQGGPHQQSVDGRGWVEGVAPSQTDAGQHRHLATCHLEGRAEAVEERIRNHDGVWLVRQQYRELVATEPCERVRFGQPLA